MSRENLIWIQGAGELASGVALRLVRSGFRLVMAEIANPLAVRRLVSFSEAVYEGQANVEGEQGVLVERIDPSNSQNKIRIVVDPKAEQMALCSVAAVIDARMTKVQPQGLPSGNLFAIGLGPGFLCGRDCDMVVETHRGARLGEVLKQGGALANTGIPGVVGGHSSRRVVYSPGPGKMIPQVKIGDLVSNGQRLGTVSGHPVVSNLDGMVRGLVHPNAELSAGEKVADVDPRGHLVDPAQVTDKSLAVGGGVLEALLSVGIFPGQD